MMFTSRVQGHVGFIYYSPRVVGGGAAAAADDALAISRDAARMAEVGRAREYALPMLCSPRHTSILPVVIMTFVGSKSGKFHVQSPAIHAMGLQFRSSTTVFRSSTTVYDAKQPADPDLSTIHHF